MRLRPLLHDRMVIRATLGSLLMVWALLLAFASVLDFAKELDDLGKGGYSVSHVLLYIVCTMPRRAYDLFPTSALIGSLLGLGGLAATSELTALRAAGVSRWRICVSAVAGLAMATALMMVSAETIGPLGEQTADVLASTAKSNGVTVSQGSGLWARDGNVFINAGTGARRVRDGDNEVDLANLRLFAFDADARLISVTKARQARYRRGAWTLHDVMRTAIGDQGVTLTHVATMSWTSGLSPEAVLAGVEHPRFQSTASLGRSIAYMRRNAVDPGNYENAYWARWFYPLNVLALCLAALPFAFGQLRSGGFGKRLFLGIVCGLSFFLLQRLAQNLATIYRLPLWGAHLLPPLLVLMASRLYFWRRT